MREHELDRLQDDVARFTALIQKLTSSKDEMAENVPRGTERMPVAELVQCHGLACTHVTKAGIGMGFEHGHGFVLAKLPSDVTAVAPGQKRTMWSAPLFINLNAGSLGATLGWSSIDSVTILDTPQAVDSFRHRVFELETDVTGALGSAAAAHQPATIANLSDTSLTSREFTYSLASGMMVDVSLSGMIYSLDKPRNASIYGELTSPAAILDGGMAPPAPMQELYDALDKAMQAYSELPARDVAAAPPVEAGHAHAD